MAVVASVNGYDNKEKGEFSANKLITSHKPLRLKNHSNGVETYDALHHSVPDVNIVYVELREKS